MITRIVREFTSVCHEDLPQKPQPFTQKQIHFLKQMVNDELEELEEAIPEDSDDFGIEDLVGQQDAIVDLLYYVADVCVRQGWNIDPIFERVHAANMRKIVDGKVIKNTQGKVLKPENWFGPEEEIKEIIEFQLEHGTWEK